MAVWPPAAVVATLATLAALVRGDVAGLRWTAPEQWHVTLRFLGSVDDPGPVRAALVAVEATAADVIAVEATGAKAPVEAPVEAVLGPEVGRFGRTVLHVPVRGLEGLATAVAAATAHVGDPLDDRPFTGHITLARSRRGGVDLRPWCGTAVAGRWRVEELTLVESHLGPGGARYDVLDRFPLRP